MKLHQVEQFASRLMGEIDVSMRNGSVPTDALTFEDVCKHVTVPFTALAGLDKLDRRKVVHRVDEALRVRSGGVY